MGRVTIDECQLCGQLPRRVALSVVLVGCGLTLVAAGVAYFLVRHRAGLPRMPQLPRIAVAVVRPTPDYLPGE
jgi:hypothetical protein